MSEDAAELLSLVGLPSKEILDTDTSVIQSLHRGNQYSWDKAPQVSHKGSSQDTCLNLSLWFAYDIRIHENRTMFQLCTPIINVFFVPQECNFQENDKDLEPQDWLISKVQEFENGDVNVVHVPVHESTDRLGQYTIDLLYSDQKRIVTKVVAKLHEWL